MSKQRKLFLLVPLLLFAVASRALADITTPLATNMQMGSNDDYGDVGSSFWGGGHVDAYKFATVKDYDEIIITNNGNEAHSVQITAGRWGNDVTRYNWQTPNINPGQSVTIQIHEANGCSTNDIILALAKYGLILNGHGSSSERTFPISAILVEKGTRPRVLIEGGVLGNETLGDGGNRYGGFTIAKTLFSDIQNGDVITVTPSCYRTHYTWVNAGDKELAAKDMEVGATGTWPMGKFEITVGSENINDIKTNGLTVSGNGKPYGDSTPDDEHTYHVKVTLKRSGVNLFQVPYGGQTTIGTDDTGSGWYKNGANYAMVLKCFIGSIQANSDPSKNPGMWFKFTGASADSGLKNHIAFRVTMWKNGDQDNTADYEFSNYWYKDASFRYGTFNNENYIWIQFTNDMIDLLQQDENGSALRVVGDGTITITDCGFDYYPNNVDAERGWNPVNGIWISDTRVGNEGDTSGTIYTGINGSNGSTPPNPVPSNGLLHWTITNTDKAIFVDSEGNEKTEMDTYYNNTPRVKFKSAGTSVITVTAWDDRTKTMTQTVTVRAALKSIHVAATGENRQFKCDVPDVTDKSKLPVVISLHGGGGHYYDYMIPFITGERNLPNEKGFLLITPEGNYNSTRGNGWDARRGSSKETEFLKAIVDDLKANPSDYGITSIDEDRVYVCGWSNGGMMAYQAMAQAPGYFAAGASVGGIPFNEFHLNTAGDRPVAFLHIHGGADEAVVINPALGKPYTLDIQTHLDNMAYRNGCYPKAKETVDRESLIGGAVLTKYVYSKVNDNGVSVDFEYHHIDKMNHTAGWADQTYGYDVPTHMWNYFDQKRLNKSAQALKFRTILKSSTYKDYLGEGGDGFDVRKHGWTINGKTWDKASNRIVDVEGADKVLASYGEATTQQYYTIDETDGTAWYRGTISNGGFMPGDYTGTSNHNIYHSIQLANDAKHHLRFQTSTTDGDYVTVQIYRYDVTQRDQYGNPVSVTANPLFDGEGKRYYADNSVVYVNFETCNNPNGHYDNNGNACGGWHEYKVVISKGKATDNTVISFVEIIGGEYPNPTGEFFIDPAGIVPSDLMLVRQPVYGRRATVAGGSHAEAANQAKEYIAIADMYRHEEDPNDGKVKQAEKISSTWLADGVSTSTITDGLNKKNGTNNNNTIAYVLGIKNESGSWVYDGTTSYNINRTDGLCLSQYGPAYIDKFRLVKTDPDYSPLTKGALIMKVAGTVDVTLFCKIKYTEKDKDIDTDKPYTEASYKELTKEQQDAYDDDNGIFKWSQRRVIKVYYMNNINPGKLIPMPVSDKYDEVWALAPTTRNDVSGSFSDDVDKYGWAGQPLTANVRLPQLGTDGTCYLYFVYDGLNGLKSSDQTKYGISPTNNDVWIQGFQVKRPDLKVTIGRTDKVYEDNGKSQGEGTLCTAYGENKPYVWEFEENRTNDSDAKRNFLNPHYGRTSDIIDVNEKVNTTDYRTYITGILPNGQPTGDHLLVYSENPTSFGHFVGRSGSEPAHLQFDTPTQIRYKKGEDSDGNAIYADQYEPVSADINYNGDGSIFDPIINDGLKVNVTGSGWFKVRAKVPIASTVGDQHAVKMTVMTSVNGNEHIRLVRNFKIQADGQYHDYYAYIKAQQRRDSDLDAEMTQQSIFLTFEDIGFDRTTSVPETPDVTGVYEGDKNMFQINIERMEWLNDPAPDYVYQREQYLFKSQTPNEQISEHINRHYLRTRQEVEKSGETLLYWQAGGGSKNAAYMKKDGEAVDINGTVVNNSGVEISNDDSALEEGRWAYDMNWFYEAGKGFAHTTRNSRSSTGDNDKFEPSWSIAAVPTLGLQHIVESEGAAHPNVDGIQNQTCSHGHKSPLWQGAHTEMQAPRILPERLTVTDNGDRNKDFDNFLWSSRTEYTPRYSDSGDKQINTDYDLPISGPFFRFIPMKNVKVTAYVIPGNDTGTIYLLDETGNCVNKSAANTDAWKVFGTWTATSAWGVDMTINNPTAAKTNNAIRLVMELRAGKEYFLCSTGMAIGIAAMNFEKIGTDEIGLYNADGTETNAQLYDEGKDVNAMIDVACKFGNEDYTGTKYSNVKLHRTFEANKWYSLVLPFSMNEELFQKYFGTPEREAQCIHFEKIEEDNTITLLHHRYNMIVAGRPVFIRPSKTFTSGTLIENVTLQTNEVVSDPFTGGGDKINYQFTGSFSVPITLDKRSILMSAGKKNGSTKYAGQMLYVPNGGSMNGLRAWIKPFNPEYKDTEEEGGAKFNYASFDYIGNLLDEDDITGIENIFIDQANEDGIKLTVVKHTDKIYDLNGRAVATGTKMNNLPKGIYIINGKKFVK